MSIIFNPQNMYFQEKKYLRSHQSLQESGNQPLMIIFPQKMHPKLPNSISQIGFDLIDMC